MKEEKWRQHILKPIQQFIDAIPENGAVQVAGNSWESKTDYQKKAIGKINGRLEFFEYDDDYGQWNTVFIWHYSIEPEAWENHFDFSCMPRKTGKVFRNVFI